MMKVTLRGYLEFTGGMGFGRSETESRVCGTGSRISAKGANNRSVSTEGELLDLCCNGCRKVMLPNTQSIKGL